MFDVPAPFQSKGLEEYRKTWDLFFKWASNPAVFDIMEMNITAGDDVAFATAVMQCAGTEVEGAKLDFRLTLGLKKIAGQWTIVHEHHSVPAE
jgi:ketosteroid isomerase-like protein